MAGLPHGDGGGPYHHRDLGQLRGLDGHAHPQPAAGAVDLGRDGVGPGQDDEHQEGHRAPQQRPRQLLPDRVGKPGAHAQDHEAHHGPAGLAEDEVGVGQLLAQGQHRGGAVERHQAEGQEQEGQDEDRRRLPSPPQPRVGEGDGSGGGDVQGTGHHATSRTRSAKRRPRSS